VSAPGPITVTTPDGTATSAASFGTGFAVTGFSPTSGRVGATVTITGTGLGAATAVLFNGGGATFKVVSATSLTAVVPLSGSTGKIAVKAGTVTARSATNFLVIPVVTSFSPTSGRAGTVVDIRGSGFVNATAVLFGGVAASTYTVVSGGEIKATVPSGALSGKITVRTAGGSAKSTGNFAVLKGARAAPAHR
jgi:hypothetical protein